MSDPRYEIAQWLAEIKALQQQLAQLAQERDGAIAQEKRWRSLYEMESQQRRAEAQQFCPEVTALPDRAAIEAEIAGFPNGQAVVETLITIWQERDRLQLQVQQLSQALMTEQTDHAQTRQRLTQALEDTLDLFNQTFQEGEQAID